MTTFAYHLSRVRVESHLGRRIMCEWLHLHDFSRWELLTATLKEGRSSREIVVQCRECLHCNLFQQRLL